MEKSRSQNTTKPTEASEKQDFTKEHDEFLSNEGEIKEENSIIGETILDEI